MNAVVYYSNTGQSRAVAEYLGKQLCYPAFEMESCGNVRFNNLVLVFPVYCQNIPDLVKTFLDKADIVNLTAVATYGKMCYGNVLYEIQHRYRKNIVAGAYIPTKHSYIADDEAFSDFGSLAPLIEKINNPSEITVPKEYKNPFANLLPKLRSCLGLKISKNANCNGCGICTELCGYKAIEAGNIDSKCIRCLKCVNSCPNNALTFKVNMPLKLYLQKKKVNKLIIYV